MALGSNAGLTPRSRPLRRYAGMQVGILIVLSVGRLRRERAKQAA